MTSRLRILLSIAVGLAVLAACGTTEPPPATTFELAVTVAGTGTGTVTSTPAGIDTPTATTAEFDDGDVVTLTATPTGGSTFAGWGGACSGTTATCDVTMDAAKSVTATFTAPVVEGDALLEVTVVEAGAAEGAVVSDPAGIDIAGAGTDSFVFPLGTTVTLTATATAEGFAGWTGGDCAGLMTLTCVVTIDEDEPAVSAVFNDVTTLSLVIAQDSDSSEEFLADSFSNAVNFPVGFSRMSSSDIELAYDDGHAPQIIGLRFVGVEIPAGARILTAELGFTADPVPGTAGQVDLTIQAQASVAPSTFVTDPATTASFDITGRDATTASAAWTITEAWTSEQIYTSANAANVLQEVIGLDGWFSDPSNAVVFLIEADDIASTELRRAYDYNTDPAKAPTLTIEFVPMPVS